MTSSETLFADAEMVEAVLPAPLCEPSECGAGQKDLRKSFTADSPYYTSFVEKEMHQVEILSETLREISKRAKTFGRCGALMSESTRRLAAACRLQSPPSPDSGEEDAESRQEVQEKLVIERKESVGDDMANVLQVLAEVLDEIAAAQVQMVETLEASLVVSLEAFADTEMEQVSVLKADAEATTDSAEASFCRYLNGRHADRLNDGTPVDAWNKLSEQVGSQISSTLQKWKSGGDMVASSTPDRSFKGWRSKSEDSNSSASARRSRSGNIDPTIANASTAANLQLSLEQIRLAQTSAELKRFQLLKKLVSIKKRRNFELGESALASLHGIRAYFHHCSDLVQGLAPSLNRIQNEQTISREKHQAEQAPWEEREASLVESLQQVGQAVDEASATVEGIAQGEQDSIEGQSTSLTDIEQASQIWNFPSILAESSLYQRDTAPGVLVEGWLYKKSSSRMALQQWNRRWFMMDKNGIYYFHSNAEKKNNGGYLHTLERVKICDTVLCMVRELQQDGLRFRFEIVTPNQRPLQLQARGPEDYKMWVEGIRMGAQNQLVHGDVSPDELMQGLGKKKKKRRDTNASPEKTLATMVESNSDDGLGDTAVPGGEVSRHSNRYSDDENDEDRVEERRKPNPMVQQILDANPVCADCGKPFPDWACINLGVLICIECSGVHRSLGVHLSKVRSLRLDSLSDSEGRLLLCLGNDRVNPIWEAGLQNQRGWKKPDVNDSRKAKEDWIKSKYQWKGFLELNSSDGSDHTERTEKFSRDLYVAASEGNVLGVAEALAHGGSVEWRNPQDGGKTPLHACAMGKAPDDDEDDADDWHGIECAELLLQNGARMKTLDDNHQGPLDCAVIGGAEREMIEFLSERSS